MADVDMLHEEGEAEMSREAMLDEHGEEEMDEESKEDDNED